MGSLEPVSKPLTILITGGSGFIGKAVRAQIGRRHKVEVFSRATGGDVLDLDALCAAAQGKDCVVHLAGLAEGPRQEVFTTNIQGTVNVAEAATRAGASLVFASSAAVYQPMTDYGVSKHLAEEVVRRYAGAAGLDACILRIFNVYGPGATQSVVNRFLHDDPIVLHGDGSTVRDFVHVEDVATAFGACLRPRGLVESDVGTGRGTRLDELAKQVGKRVVRGPPPGPQIHVSVASHVQIPGWQPATDLRAWLQAQVLRPAGRSG